MNKITLLNHHSLCPLPWNGIFVNPDGKIKNCAISGQALGDINQESIQDVINNDINQSIRQDMLNNVRHKRCNACYSVEDNASSSGVNASNRSWYKKIALNHTDMTVFDSTKNFNLTVLDLRWHNTCNCACVYCDPNFSSKWESLVNTDQVAVNPNSIEQSKKYIFDQLASVKHVYLAGGEPLLMKDNVELLKQLYVVNPNVEIRINSNISVITGPVFKQLEKFKNVRWTISVDSNHDIFEYMRWPGKWHQFVSNALAIKELVGDQINFNMVWCILNSSNILDTIDELLALGFHENMFVVQCLRDPTPLSVLHLPQQHIENLKIKIGTKKESSNPNWWLYKSLDSMYNFLSNEPPAFKENFLLKNGREGLSGTIDYLRAVDQLQNNSSQTVFKELYQIYDSN
jgi:radical SAM protein with 4Fe4S-binding SPASM domain